MLVPSVGVEPTCYKRGILLTTSVFTANFTELSEVDLRLHDLTAYSTFLVRGLDYAIAIEILSL